MKSTSSLFTFQKILLAGAVLLCVPPASAEVKVEIFRTHAARSNDFLMGALTLDNVYAFDFATAGIGSVTFRAKSNRAFTTFADEITREMPRTVGDWTNQTSSFLNMNFVSSGGFHRPITNRLAFDTEADTDVFAPNLAVMPEPSTWVGAALALAAIGFTQRGRFLRRKLV